MKRVMLTGGSGFVGANLVRRLLADGCEVHLLLRPNFSPWRIKDILNDLHVHPIEFHDAANLDSVIKSIRPEWVFHLAAAGAYSWQTDLAAMIQTNIIGTINLVEACLRTGFDTFINTGSSSEYGFKLTAPAETTWLEPNSHYAVTKASASQYCRYIAQSKDVRVNTLRLYSVYGPYEDPRRLMPSLIRHGLKGELPPLVNPDIARDYIHINDVVDAFLLAAKKEAQETGAIYNIGSGKQTSLKEVVELARQEMGINTEPDWGSMLARIWDTNTWVANIQKASTELGWSPQLGLQEGFRSTVQWYSKNFQYLDSGIVT
jgi:UDP-glucose 4-epimerase